MMRRILFISFMLCLTGLFSCIETITEVDGKDYYENDQLAIVGYLSNFGAVVNVQKTQSPLTENKIAIPVADAIVELISSDKEDVIMLVKADDYTFVTPVSFIPKKEKEYFIKVFSSGFKEVISSPQKVLSMPPFKLIELIIKEENRWAEDPTPFRLFGQPRRVDVTYYIDNNDSAITNNLSKMLFRYKSELYEYSSGNFNRYTYPHFFLNIGVGVNHLLEIPQLFSYKLLFFDQIKTNETIDYKGTNWQVIDRVESVIIQSGLFSPDFVRFFESVNEYLEERSDPFSIMAEKLPSNMSNQIGYFGSICITEEEIPLPKSKNTTIVIEFKK
jgi:hypothetical protein